MACCAWIRTIPGSQKGRSVTHFYFQWYYVVGFVAWAIPIAICVGFIIGWRWK